MKRNLAGSTKVLLIAFVFAFGVGAAYQVAIADINHCTCGCTYTCPYSGSIKIGKPTDCTKPQETCANNPLCDLCVPN